MTCHFHKLLNIAFNIGEKERPISDSADKLLMSMRTTAKCRYNASVRLDRQGKISFYATIVFSLGLVFISLAQNSGIELFIPIGFISMAQVFLSISVLVYSVVIGMAKYELRASRLNDCGDRLKELIRELDAQRSRGSVDDNTLLDFQKRYSLIVTDVENHVRNDYRQAKLEMTRDYYIRGIPRGLMRMFSIFSVCFEYALPLGLVLAEIVFILDMMGVTSFLPDSIHIW